MDNIPKDPNGIAQNEPGAKLDSGKIDMGLLYEGFPRALMAVAEVGTFGAQKYSRGGWQYVPGAPIRYKAALHRHLAQGEMTPFDDESCLLHAAHAAWNALAVLELRLRADEYAKDQVEFALGDAQ